VTDDFVCIVVMHSVVTTDDFTQSGYSHSECTKSQYDWQTTPQEPFRWSPRDEKWVIERLPGRQLETQRV